MMSYNPKLHVLPSATDQDDQGSVLHARNLSVWFADRQALHGVDVRIPQHGITALVGPSGSGKSTLIRCFNRLHDEREGVRTRGEVHFMGRDINRCPAAALPALRARIGMVFQKPCIFPGSIRDNVLFGVQRLRRIPPHQQTAKVEQYLRDVALWPEVQHRLQASADTLSQGQQQRLCLARTLAIEPELILLDEPTSSLDPVSTRAIEELMLRLKARYTLVLVTHDILQARRVADHMILLCDGKVVEQGSKVALFERPQHETTRAWLAGGHCDC